MTHRNLISILYNDHFIDFNIKSISGHEDFICTFLTVDEILNGSYHQRVYEEFEKTFNNKKDLFLMKYSNNLKLCNEILKYGQYWPLMMDMENNMFSPFEGNHRINSIYSGYHAGIWPKDKKIFCIIVKEHLRIRDAREDIRKQMIILNDDPKKILHQKKYKLSSPLRLKVYFSDINYDKRNKYILENSNVKIIQKEKCGFADIYEVEVNNVLDFYLCYSTLTADISNDIFMYYEKQSMIYPSKKINI